MFDHLHLVSLAFSWGDFRAEWILQSLQFRLLFLINVAPHTAIYAFHELSCSSPPPPMPDPPCGERGKGSLERQRGSCGGEQAQGPESDAPPTPPR